MKGFGKGLLTGIVLCVTILCIYIFGSYAFNWITSLSKTPTGEYNSIDSKLDNIEDILEKEYYEDFDEKDLEANAIKGYLEGLGDPYSVYYTSEEYKSFNEDIDGTYEGIGAYIGYGDSKDILIIVSPIEGSPADKAGLKAQDIILKVDGNDVVGFTTDEIVKVIKGPAGTEVAITVLRGEEEKEIKITRDSIDIQTVRAKRIDENENIGYIRIASFDGVTYDQFVKEFDEMKNDIDGLIIDLRYNPGGLTNIVSAIADELLPKDLIIYYTEDKDGNKELIKTLKDTSFDKPIVVLVNEGSASASEILSGALKDHGRATLVGTTTFGKGLVQISHMLKDGSAIKLTIAKYFTPSGSYIHKKGIEPDVLSELPELEDGEEWEEGFDPQLDDAVKEILKKIN